MNSATSQVPDRIMILDAFTPKEVGEGLTSPKLEARLQGYESSVGAMWGAFEETDLGSVNEEAAAARLAEYYMLKKAARLQGIPLPVRFEETATTEFNTGSDELYGEVDPVTVSRLAAEELSNLSPVLESTEPSILSQVYSRLVGEKTAESTNKSEFMREEDRLIQRDALFAKIPEIYEVLTEVSEGPFTSSDTRSIFTKILTKLSETDSAWAEWKITNPEGKTMLSVVPNKKEIEIPDGRADTESKIKLLGLAYHEIGVHALRSVKGGHLNDMLLSVEGLHGNIDFEEGLGVYFEYLVTGKVDEKNVDRYIDIALAKGAVDGFRLSRNDLIKLGTEREIARAKLQGKKANETGITKKVHDHINRIFRGGTAIPVQDEDGQILNQAVYSKDLVYYQGLVKVHDYVEEQLKSGISFEEILSFLLTGKFDATNPRHITYMSEKYGIKI